LLRNFLFSQDMKIKWQDNNGREINIIAPSGELSYGMLSVNYGFMLRNKFKLKIKIINYDKKTFN
jgi:hypothetical protein